MECEIVDNEYCVDKEPDVIFSSNFEGVSYEVSAWSTVNGLSVCIEPYGTFEKMVCIVKPELGDKEAGIMAAAEFCKCVTSAAQLLVRFHLAKGIVGNG